jgi:hypothetical protein
MSDPVYENLIPESTQPGSPARPQTPVPVLSKSPNNYTPEWTPGKSEEPNAVDALKSARDKLLKLLYQNENPKVDHLMKKIELKTGQKRENVSYSINCLNVSLQIAYGVLGTLLASVSLYLLFGEHARYLSNLIGFVFPA